MTMKTKLLAVATLAMLAIGSLGCSNKFWDPTQIGRFRAVPVQHVILDSLGVAEEKSSVYEDAEDPKPKDILPQKQDTRFSPGDVVRISIYELLEENQPFINDFIVTESGQISIPEVGSVQAAGLTEKQLEEEIRNILMPNILKDPAVTVILQSSEKRVFSIYGQGLLGSPGRYSVPRYNFRLAEAIAQSGGISEFNVSYIYVTREATPEEMAQKLEALGNDNSSAQSAQEEVKSTDKEPKLKATEPSADENKTNKDELLNMIAPCDGVGKPIIASAELTTEQQLENLAKPKQEDKTADVNANVSQDEQASADDSNSAKVEWIFKNGKWVPVNIAPKKTTQKAVAKEMPQDFETKNKKISKYTSDEEAIKNQARVIKIEYDKLIGGDPRYNIIIKEGDTISVPVDMIGECVIMGNVNAQGYIPLTGRPMTLMQAIAAAGGLGPLAAPENVEVRRRIGKKREEIVQVNLQKIAEGLQPDFFIKKDDTINVGTNSAAMWKAVLRNSFRATYGFGFVYDRNYGVQDIGTGRPFNF